MVSRVETFFSFEIFAVLGWEGDQNSRRKASDGYLKVIQIKINIKGPSPTFLEFGEMVR